jgi:hypothetical protein
VPLGDRTTSVVKTSGGAGTMGAGAPATTGTSGAAPAGTVAGAKS